MTRFLPVSWRGPPAPGQNHTCYSSPDQPHLADTKQGPLDSPTPEDNSRDCPASELSRNSDPQGSKPWPHPTHGTGRKGQGGKAKSKCGRPPLCSSPETPALRAPSAPGGCRLSPRPPEQPGASLAPWLPCGRRQAWTAAQEKDLHRTLTQKLKTKAGYLVK